MGKIAKGLEYLKSIPAIVKIAEFVVLLIAMACVGYFLDKTTGSYSKKGNLQFFMFVVVVGWLLVIGLFTVFVIGLQEKVTNFSWPLVVAIVSAVWALLLLISSALLASAVDHYNSDIYYWYHLGRRSYCDALDAGKADPRCGHLIAGTLFGFVAMVLFGLDTFLHVRLHLAPADTTAPTVPAPVST